MKKDRKGEIERDDDGDGNHETFVLIESFDINLIFRKNFVFSSV